MNAENLSTLVNAIKYYIKTMVAADADPFGDLASCGLMDPVIDDDRVFFTDENNNVFVL